MSVTATTVWELRTTGSDSNGGGFDPAVASPGTDYSTQDAAQLTWDGTTNSLTIDATSTSQATCTQGFTSAHVGNVVNITGGTNFTPGRYVITAVSAGKATFNATIGTATGATGGAGTLGGGMATPGAVAGAKVAGNDVYCKAGTYAITSTTANVPAGRINDTAGGVGQANQGWWASYDTTRTRTNTDANRAIFQASGSLASTTLFTVGAGFTIVRGITIDGNAKSGVAGLNLNAANTRAARVLAKNCTGTGITLGSSLANCAATRCEATANATGLSAGNFAHLFYCEAHDNTGHGFSIASGVTCVGCVAANNTGASTDGFHNNAGQGYDAFNCVAYGNGRYGFDLTGTAVGGGQHVNCVAYGNTSDGWGSDGVKDGVGLLNCAGGGNGGNGNYLSANLPNVESFVSLSGDPFASAATGNFAPNSTSGAGAALRAAGFPGTLPRGTVGYADIGAAQHQDAGGGGGLIYLAGMTGGFQD